MSAITTLPLRDGVAIDFAAPAPGSIYIRDIAERLARTCCVPSSPIGFYSLAQRSCLLAHEIGGSEGPEAGCYALLWFAPKAMTGFMEPSAIEQLCEASRFVGQQLREMNSRLAAAVFNAVDLDAPAPAAIAKAIAAATARLDLAEQMCVRGDSMARARAVQASGVKPLVNRIAPLNWDKAYDQFVTTWQSLAAAANLPCTPAWNGIAYRTTKDDLL
jgi:hypothetical protein